MTKIVIKNRFGIIPNEILNSKELSFKAKGLYGYIQSKPDGWDFSIERISSQTGEGITSVRSGIQELENYGCLVREKLKNEQGFWEMHYELYGEKIHRPTEKPVSENPMVENPMVENPMVENLYNNSKKEYSKKELRKKERKEDLNFIVATKVATESDRNKKYFPFVSLLETIIVQTKHIKVTHQKKNGWANSVRLLVEADGVTIDRLENALQWYKSHHTDDFVPVIESGKSLREKFTRLEDAMQRKSKTNRQRTTGFKKGKLTYQKAIQI